MLKKGHFDQAGSIKVFGHSPIYMFPSGKMGYDTAILIQLEFPFIKKKKHLATKSELT